MQADWKHPMGIADEGLCNGASGLKPWHRYAKKCTLPQDLYESYIAQPQSSRFGALYSTLRLFSFFCAVYVNDDLPNAYPERWVARSHDAPLLGIPQIFCERSSR